MLCVLKLNSLTSFLAWSSLFNFQCPMPSLLGFIALLSRKRLVYYITPFSFCQHLFSFFFTFFSPPLFLCSFCCNSLSQLPHCTSTLYKKSGFSQNRSLKNYFKNTSLYRRFNIAERPMFDNIIKFTRLRACCFFTY